MQKADQPLGLIGFLFALSIGFWGLDMTAYFQEGLCTGTGADRVCTPFGFTTLSQKIVIVWMLTLVAGLVFLADIVCIMWWYAMYIYKVQRTASLPTYFLDFGVCAMVAAAANKWTVPTVFLLAVLAASLLLGGRFTILYRSNEASDTDRRIMKAAGTSLLIAAIICLAFLGLLGLIFPGIGPYLISDILHPGLVIILSGIGIWLTIRFRRKIRVSADIHESGTLPFVPINLHWPSKLTDDSDSKHLIIDQVRKGLERFQVLFRGADPKGLEHDRLRSRVHPEGDIRVQSYILAIPSWTPSENPKIQIEEINNKAFMVGVSHWVDDLVDGRGELEVYKRLKKEPTLGLSLDDAENIFDRIYKDIIVDHTSDNFYENLLLKMKESASPGNQKYLFFSLNRVAIGAAIFGPKVKETERKKLLEKHNETVVEQIGDEGTRAAPGSQEWYFEVKKIIQEMRGASGELGEVLLGLTTKTVQEMAMASERHEVNFTRSVLYSLLYAPLLYFHDRDGELACSEIVPLESFDVSYDGILPWLLKIRDLIEKKKAPEDPRKSSRLEQLKMAFRCFSPKLPQVARDELAAIYAPPARIATAREVMDLPETASVKEAASLMDQKRIGAVLITENGRLQGIFTERDITTRVVGEGLDPKETKLAKVMTRDPDTIPRGATAREALAQMSARGYRHVPVVEGDRLVGIISIRDLYQAVKQELEEDIKDRDSVMFGPIQQELIRPK